MTTFSYSDDGKTLNVSDRRDQIISIPVEVLDFLNSIYVGNYLLQDAKAYRHLTVLKDGSPVSEPSIVSAESLIGVDLTDKVVRVFHANYEDSEWLSTDSALTVRASDDGSYCSFVFPKEYEDWYNNVEDNPEMDEKIPYDVDRLLGFSFHSTSDVWVADKKAV